MKKVLFITLIILYSFFTFSQDIQKITFCPTSVKIARRSLFEIPYKDAVEIRIGGKIESYNIANKNKSLVETHNNAFVTAVHYAYSSHRPLTISPDMVWLLIEQGFVFHLHYYSDSLKSTIVSFKGKKTITVENNYFLKGNENNNWAGEISKFSDSIKNYIGKDLHYLLVPEFSTTSTNEKIAYEITLMDAVEKYFDYVDITFCGIPEITLEGTPEDWKKIYDNTQKLSKYGLTKWINKLNPLLKELINTSEGKMNTNFWNSIYKIKTSYNQGLINGWIVNFFPYLNNGIQLIKNPIITGEAKYLDADMLPQGINKVTFKWKHFPDKKTYNMEFYAGFIGIQQDTVTKNLIPEIGWAVRDTNDDKTDKYLKSEFYGLIDKDNFDRQYSEDSIFVQVDQLPEFPGGMIGLRRYVNQEFTNSPKKTLSNISFKIIVKKDGSIGKVEVIKGGSKEINKKIIQILKTCPKFKPGRYRGQPVKSLYYFNI